MSPYHCDLKNTHLKSLEHCKCNAGLSEILYYIIQLKSEIDITYLYSYNSRNTRPYGFSSNTMNLELNYLRMNYRFERIAYFSLHKFQVASHLQVIKGMAYIVCYAFLEK